MSKQFNKTKWFAILFIAVIFIITTLFPSPDQPQIKYIDRESGIIKTEIVAGEKWLVWLYNNPVGEATMWTLVKRKFVSTIYGKMMDKPASVDKIQPFIDEFDIDTNIAKKQQFESFNDFFTRKLKPFVRPIDTNINVVVSPADGKVMAWSNISNNDFLVKGYRFNVSSFLNDEVLGEKYRNSSLIIIRLAPSDYHRFHFPISGSISPITFINGDYYSVNPIALREMVEIFCMNKREYVMISNPIFGDVIMAEVGATMVGSINQTYTGDKVLKGAEKGYFEFGGSTVVLLFEKGRIIVDRDLLQNTVKGLETSIKMGERIGIKLE